MEKKTVFKICVLVGLFYLINCVAAVPPKNKLRSVPGDVLLNDFLASHGIIRAGDDGGADEDQLEKAKEFVHTHYFIMYFLFWKLHDKLQIIHLT